MKGKERNEILSKPELWSLDPSNDDKLPDTDFFSRMPDWVDHRDYKHRFQHT